MDVGGDNGCCLGVSSNSHRQEFHGRKKRIMVEKGVLHIGRSILLDKRRKKLGLKSEFTVLKGKMCLIKAINHFKGEGEKTMATERRKLVIGEGVLRAKEHGEGAGPAVP